MSMVRLHMMHDRFVFRPEKLRSLAKCRLRDFIFQSITNKTRACAPEAARGTLRLSAYSSYSVPSRTTVPSLPRGTMAALTDEGAPRLGKPKRESRGGTASGSV